MDVQLWLKQVRRCCQWQGLPHFYIERLLIELADHHLDSLEDTVRKDASGFHPTTNLGTPQAIATRAASEFRQTRFCGRHPIIAFIVLPVVALPLLWAAAMIATLLFARLLGFESGHEVSGTWQEWAEWSLPACTMAAVLAPIAIAAWLFCFLARRSAVGWKWTLAAAGLLAVFGSLAVMQMVLPAADHQGSFSFGLGISTSPSAVQIVQFVLPLAIAGWTIARQTGLTGRERTRRQSTEV